MGMSSLCFSVGVFSSLFVFLLSFVTPRLWGVGFWLGEKRGNRDFRIFGDLIEKVFENGFRGLVAATFV